MKKAFKKSLALTVAILFICISLTSCGIFQKKPETAEELWNRIDETMTNLTSYEANISLDMSYEIESKKFTAKGNGTLITIKENDDLYYYNSMVTEISCPELSIDQKSTSVKAYDDGAMFISNKSEGIDQNLSAKTDREAFLKAQENSGMDFDFNDSSKSEFDQDDDKSWELSFWGFDSDTLAATANEMGFSDIISDASLEDIIVTVYADKDFKVFLMDVDFIFKPEKTGAPVPTVSAEADYGKFNEASEIDIEKDKFTQVDNLLILEDIDNMLNDIYNNTDGLVTLNITQASYYDGKKKSSSKETDSITYGKKDGKYSHRIVSKINGVNTATIKYANGSQTVSSSGKTQSASLTEFEAKLFLRQLINTPKYDSSLVSNVTNNGNGVYKITLIEADPSLYENLAANITSTSATVEFTVVDGKITLINSDIKLSGTSSKTSTVPFKLTISSDLRVVK